ncbi:MAG: hypothetical protein K2U26_06280 [Cyclobacteriaceae bacterium]|nr:hypothetical protein [Cyclobacteriaceae bacterium]
MKTFIRRIIIGLVVLAVAWTVLTLWVEREGPAYRHDSSDVPNGPRALIIYDPDPFYNLDQQVCEAFAAGLASNGWNTTVATVAATHEVKDSIFNLYVICANTYNFAPDWATVDFVKEYPSLEGKNVVAITLGAGTTSRAKRLLEEAIAQRQCKLIDSRTFWLWRPNDEALIQESNVTLAVNMTRKWASEVAEGLKLE